MVRLRREIDGISVNPAIPQPTYALDPAASRLLLPPFDERLDHLDANRVLLAGVVTPSYVNRLASAGHMVTIADVDKAQVRQFHAALHPEAAGNVTLVDKPYGEATFGPSSFDAIVHLDAMHRFTKPEWAVAKAYRELKFDGVLLARVLVSGPPPEIEMSLAEARPAAWTDHAIDGVRRLSRGLASRLLVDAWARDAVDRGAHLSDRSDAMPWRALMAAMTQKLTLLDHWPGHTRRLRVASLLYGARAGIRRGVHELMGHVPIVADDDDVHCGRDRVVGVIVKKKLGNLR